MFITVSYWTTNNICIQATVYMKNKVQLRNSKKVMSTEKLKNNLTRKTLLTEKLKGMILFRPCSRSGSKREISFWKRIKCFRSTLRWRSFFFLTFLFNHRTLLQYLHNILLDRYWHYKIQSRLNKNNSLAIIFTITICMFNKDRKERCRKREKNYRKMTKIKKYAQE